MVFNFEQIVGLFVGFGLLFVCEGDDFLVMLFIWCFDIEIEEDLIEEIVCLYGYDNILVFVFCGNLKMQVQLEVQCLQVCICQMLVDCGYQEVVNFVFVEEFWESDFVVNGNFICLVNLIVSQMVVMWFILFGGLILNLVINFKCKQNWVCFFEIGCIFYCENVGVLVEGFVQLWKLVGFFYGGVLLDSWDNGGCKVDFYDIKGDFEVLLVFVLLCFEKLVYLVLYLGCVVKVLFDGSEIGCIGELYLEWV